MWRAASSLRRLCPKHLVRLAHPDLLDPILLFPDGLTKHRDETFIRIHILGRRWLAVVGIVTQSNCILYI
jgi:hypothetical protein